MPSNECKSPDTGQANAQDSSQGSPTMERSILEWYTDERCLQAYTAALAKGNALHTEVRADKPTIPPSQFRCTTDLQEWGYTLNTDINPRDNSMKFGTQYESSVTREGVTYRATDALFFNTIFTSSGTIQADNIYSPHALIKDMRSTQIALPKLSHWSDVAHLQWLYATRDLTLPPVLRTVVRDVIVNDATEMMVKHIMSQESVGGSRCGSCLKYTFASASSEGMAILGTPNRAGVAYMLIQHREGLGHRVIDEIEVFQPASGRRFGEYLKIVFHIREAEKLDEVK